MERSIEIKNEWKKRRSGPIEEVASRIEEARSSTVDYCHLSVWNSVPLNLWRQLTHPTTRLSCKRFNSKVFPSLHPCRSVSYHWGADHTGQFRHHPSASPAVIVRKVVGHHLFLNIIPSNFTTRIERKVWCDRGMTAVVCTESVDRILSHGVYDKLYIAVSGAIANAHI